MKPTQYQVVHIDDHRIAYDRQGEGNPVVLIHGIPTSRLLWRNVMPALAKAHQVFAPDMLNYGQSDKPADANVSIEAQSRLMAKLMDQLELKVADSVAHDVGGGVAQLIAVNYPERVRKLVLIDTVSFDSWPIPEFLPLQEPGAERALQRKLTRRGLVTRTRIVRRAGESLIAEDGSRIDADVVVLALGLEANPLVHEMGLPTHSKNGLRINGRLYSIADQRVFAGGDCAAMEGFDLPKPGVFGVRQAVYIYANLLASSDGKLLAEYTPQKRYLAILNLGDGTALSTWGPFWWNGRSSMWLKDHIDRRFLEGYRRQDDRTRNWKENRHDQ